MTHPENDAAARALGSLLRDGASASEAAPERLEAEARRLMERARSEPRGRGAGGARRILLAASVFGVLGALSLGFLVVRSVGEAPVGWAVEGEARVEGEFVRTTSDSATLRFSEGSTVELAPAAQVRVSELEDSGARVTVLDGKVSSRIVHRDATRYRIQAGPYEVSVIGTTFDTEWTRADQTLRITMIEGTVGVTGAGIAGSVTLTKGQRLEASGETRTWTVLPVGAPDIDSASREPDTDEPEGVAERPPKKDSEVRSLPTKDGAGTWTAAIAKGDFARVLSEARAMGIDRCLATCGAKELRALGDAARYRGDFAVARSALTALRERTPSERGRAAYLLGTLGEAQGDPRGALGWYRKSIAESPAGPLAAEARAGALRVTLAVEGKNAARPLAEEYLRLYPDGVGAETARRILAR